MSVYKKVSTNNEDKKNTGDLQNESPLIILKNENNNLGDELN